MRLSRKAHKIVFIVVNLRWALGEFFAKSLFSIF